MIWRRQRDLAGQLAFAMMAVAMVCLTLSVLSFYIIYLILYLANFQIAFPVEDMSMNEFDFLGLAIGAAISLTVASFVAIAAARRIARPLRSIARAARRIAGGDLAARASSDKDAPTEAVAMITDFNLMATQLEQAASSIITWNAQIAHELRTPLTILNGRLQGLVDGVFVPDDKIIKGLLTQVQGLTRLVDDLRIVSLSDSGHLHLEVRESDVAAEVDSFVDLVEPTMATAGFKVVTRLERGVARVDITRVRQALLALVSNARQHADPALLTITLDLSDDLVSLAVIDDGPGMPVDFIPHAFEQFQRAESAKQERRPGSGLGLSVVHAIAKAHGGTARAERVGNGTSFIIEIPRWG